jgi:hypothetical protein
MTGSADEWYIFRSEEQRGPFPFEQLVREATAGTLLKSDFVWTPGFQDWQPAASIAALFPPEEELRAAEDRLDPQPMVTAKPASPDPATEGLQQAPKKRSNYILRHWRGELSLPVSYWINNFLGNIALVAGVYFIGLFIDGTSAVAALFAVSAYIVLMGTICLWQIVGTWRSAVAHPGRGGSRFWAGAAQVMIVIAVVRVTLDFSQGLGPIWLENAKMAIGGDTEFQTATLTLLRNGTELEFSGGINQGSLKELTRILDASPDVKVVHLTSSGGRIQEGRRMGQEIRRRGLSTYVPAECSSACTSIFLGGKERWLATEAKLGFHGPNIPGIGGETLAQMIADERKEMLEDGLPGWFVSKALETSPSDMWYPTPAELQKANVITAIANPGDFAPPSSLARATKQDATDELLKFASYAAIKEVDPAAFDQLVEAVHSSARQGKSLGELTGQARSSITSTIGKHGWKISDQAAVRYLDRMHRQLERLSKNDVKACAAILKPETMAVPPDLETRFPEEFAGEHEFLAELLLSTKGGQEHRLNEAQVNDLFDEVMKDLNPETLFFPDEKTTLGYSDYVPFCASTIVLLEGALSLPQARQADFARYLLASE